MNTLMLILLAVIPPVVLLIITYVLDRKEKEPLILLVGLFFMGVLSIIPAIIIELIGSVILEVIGINETLLGAFVDAFFIVAFAEEGSKFFLMWILSWKRKAFNYRFDGIVYAVYTSLGFACAENIEYVIQNGVGTALSRAFTAVPLHCCCGVIMGIFYGYARGCAYAKNPSGVKKNIWKALLIPMVIHGFYDFCLFTQESLLIVIWAIFTLILFGTTIWRTTSYSKNDHPIVMEGTPMVFGQTGMWFPQETAMGRSTSILRQQQLQQTFGNTGFPMQNMGGMSQMSGNGMQTRNPMMHGNMVQPNMTGNMAQSAMPPMRGNMSQPMTGNMAQPVMQPMTGNMAQPVMQPMTGNMAQPVMQSMTGNMAQPVMQPMTGNMAQPVMQPMAGNMAQPVMQPMAGNMAQPNIQAGFRNGMVQSDQMQAGMDEGMTQLLQTEEDEMTQLLQAEEPDTSFVSNQGGEISYTSEI